MTAHSVSMQQRTEDEVSVTASDGEFLVSDAEDSSDLPATAGRAREKSDKEMTGMLSRDASASSAPHCLLRSACSWILGTWIRSMVASCAPPRYIFVPEVHEGLAKTWHAPFSAHTRQTSSVALTSLDDGQAKGYVDLPQVERAVGVHLCPQTAAIWRDRPRLPSKACTLLSLLVSKAYIAAGQGASMLHTIAIHGMAGVGPNGVFDLPGVFP